MAMGSPSATVAADEAMFTALRERLHPEIPFVELDANINDAIFAKRAVDMMLQLIEAKDAMRSQNKSGTDS